MPLCITPSLTDCILLLELCFPHWWEMSTCAGEEYMYDPVVHSPVSHDLTYTKCSENIESEPRAQSFVLRPRPSVSCGETCEKMLSLVSNVSKKNALTGVQCDTSLPSLSPSPSTFISFFPPSPPCDFSMCIIDIPLGPLHGRSSSPSPFRHFSSSP
jgi:hypothetical protein